MASRGGHSGFADFRNVTKRHDNNKESTSQQGLNATRVQKERQTEWGRPGRVFNRNINRGGYSRNSFPGFTQEFRIVKDNRNKLKEAGVILPEAFRDGDSDNECAVPDVGDKSSTEKLAAQQCLVTQNANGHGLAQADNGVKSSAQAHIKEVKPSSVRKSEQSKEMQTTLVGSHAVLGKGNQNRVVTVAVGPRDFSGELCCSSSDPIHVPSPGSKSAGTFGAIKREVRIVGTRQWPSDISTKNTSTSNSLVKVTSASNSSNENQSGLPTVSLRNNRYNLPAPSSSRPLPMIQYHHKLQNHVSNTKVSPHLEWKRKSISPSSGDHLVSVEPSGAPSPVDGNQVEVASLSKRLSQANVSQDEHVIIPDHIRVPDSERTHLIFGTFESEVDSRASMPASYTIMTKEDLNDHSPSSLTALDSIISTDVPHNDKIDHVSSCSPLPQSESVVPVSEHQQTFTESMEVLNHGGVGEYVVDKMVSNKIAHSQPQFQHQNNPAIENFEAYEPDSTYGIPFPSEVLGLHPANGNRLPVSAATQQPVAQMYPQQFQVPQYPGVLPYRHVFSPHFVPPMVVPNYSSNPAFPQLPHSSNYLLLPNGTSQLAANGLKYGSPHQYKQVFPGSPAGYGGYTNHNGYPISNGVIGSTVVVEDVNMSKYKDNSLYTTNPQAETADMWVQAHREIPNMASAPFYNLMGQPVSPHAYLSPHNGHATFSSAPAHLPYPGFPHTSMAMVQNPLHQMAMVQNPLHQPLAGNLGFDMAGVAPVSQVGAFQQNQLGHVGWAPPTF